MSTVILLTIYLYIADPTLSSIYELGDSNYIHYENYYYLISIITSSIRFHLDLENRV